MKLVFLVLLGTAIAIGATLYFQPDFFTNYLKLAIPTPDLVITSPRSGQKVPLRFTVSGTAKSPATISILDSKQSQIWYQSVPAGQFALNVNLILRSSPGQKITLKGSTSPTDLVVIPLTLE